MPRDQSSAQITWQATPFGELPPSGQELLLGRVGFGILIIDLPTRNFMSDPCRPEPDDHSIYRRVGLDAHSRGAPDPEHCARLPLYDRSLRRI